MTDETTHEEHVEQETIDTFTLPQEVLDKVPEWKHTYGRVLKASLSGGTYLYRPIIWQELKEISRSMDNLSRTPAVNEVIIGMLETELILEKATLFPKVTPSSASRFPAGDLEMLSRLINEASGWTQFTPDVEEL